MAYIVWLETISATSATSAGGGAVILMRQGDDWRIVHQQGDPLVDLVPPA